MACQPTGDQLVYIAAVASSIFSKHLDNDAINNFGNFFTALGSNLMLIAGRNEQIQNENTNKNPPKDTNTDLHDNKIFNMMHDMINELQKNQP